MSKIKFKLKSVCTTYVKDTKGKLYKLNPGLNTLELNYDDYVSLATALGIRVKHNSNTVTKDTGDLSKLNEPSVVESEQHLTVADTVNNTVNNTVEDTVDSTVKDDTTDAVDTDTNDEVIGDLDNSDTIDYSSWSYNKLKSEYKKITGTNCRLKKGDVIAFLQEHSNV